MSPDDPIPPEWGRTAHARLERPSEDEPRWEFGGWYSCTFPPEGEPRHHGSRGSVPAATIAIVLDETVIALADGFNMVLENHYAYDAEYYFVMRVRETLDAERWRTTPWAAFGAGAVVYAEDKFHWISYLRGQDEQSMTYGGDWDDLAMEVYRRHGGAEPADLASAATLLGAVRGGDVDLVRRCLAAGADPDAGTVTPDGVRALELGVSMARGGTALWEAATGGHVEITRALLEAGARADGRPPGPSLTPLIGALRSKQLAHVPLLLAHGADPDEVHLGKDAFGWARETGPEVLRALEDAITAHRTRS